MKNDICSVEKRGVTNIDTVGIALNQIQDATSIQVQSVVRINQDFCDIDTPAGETDQVDGSHHSSQLYYVVPNTCLWQHVFGSIG